jgi:hypothetical protein
MFIYTLICLIFEIIVGLIIMGDTDEPKTKALALFLNISMCIPYIYLLYIL